MKCKSVYLLVLSLITFFAFAEPSIPENTLSKNCLKYYKNNYLNTITKDSAAKIFVYARDETGKDFCYYRTGDRATKTLIKEATDRCNKDHGSSECKVAAINEIWMIAEDDFSQITQPDEMTLTKEDVQKIMDEVKPIVKGNCLPFFEKHLAYKGHKAFAYALDENGKVSCAQASDYVDVNYLKIKVLEQCEAFRIKQGKNAADSSCVLFSVNNEIVADESDFAVALKKLNEVDIDIFELAKTGVASELQKALDTGIDINSKDNFGYTPLLRAIKTNRFDNVKFLISKGADINIKENLGSDALNVAVYTRFNNLEMIKYLVEKGADIHTQTKRPGDTPLHNAADLGRVDVAKWLIEQGAKVNMKNNYTGTALHKAANNGSVKMLSLLLDNGALINEQTRRGITPLDDAIFRKNKEAIKFLESKGAVKNNPQHK